MVTRILKYKSVQWGLSSLLIVGMLACICIPDYYVFQVKANFPFQVMMSYLLLGLVFLIFRQPQLMFTSFACCAALCMFLKYTLDAGLSMPEERKNEPSIKVAHFNVTSFDSDEGYENAMNTILRLDADLISIQEVNNDWDEELKATLSLKYPYQFTIARLDPFGLAVYSKYALDIIEIFYYNDIPNLIGSFRIHNTSWLNHNGRKINFISSYITPPLHSTAYENLQKHLQEIAKEAKKIKAPLLTFGDYHAQPWWTEIQKLKDIGGLSDSRNGAIDLNAVFQNPTDYIMHSDHFKCVRFESVNSTSSTHLGIIGTFQFDSFYDNAQALLQ